MSKKEAIAEKGSGCALNLIGSGITILMVVVLYAMVVNRHEYNIPSWAWVAWFVFFALIQAVWASKRKG